MKRVLWVWLVIAILSGSGASGQSYSLQAGPRTIRVEEEDPDTLLGVKNGKMIISSGIGRNLPHSFDVNEKMSKFEK